MQEVLCIASRKLGKEDEVTVRIRPEPDNPVDSRAIAFECKVQDEWELIGYVVREAVESVHDALHHKVITDVKFNWIKYIIHWSRSGPGWYAGITITKQGKWPQDAVRCSSTSFS